MPSAREHQRIALNDVGVDETEELGPHLVARLGVGRQLQREAAVGIRRTGREVSSRAIARHDEQARHGMVELIDQMAGDRFRGDHFDRPELDHSLLRRHFVLLQPTPVRLLHQPRQIGDVQHDLAWQDIGLESAFGVGADPLVLRCFVAKMVYDRDRGVGHWLAVRLGPYQPAHPLCLDQRHFDPRGLARGNFYLFGHLWTQRLLLVDKDARKRLAHGQFRRDELAIFVGHPRRVALGRRQSDGQAGEWCSPLNGSHKDSQAGQVLGCVAGDFHLEPADRPQRDRRCGGGFRRPPMVNAQFARQSPPL